MNNIELFLSVLIFVITAIAPVLWLYYREIKILKKKIKKYKKKLKRKTFIDYAKE